MSDFLFSHPSAVSGIARIFGIFRPFSEYNTSPTEVEADVLAMRNDFAMTGRDLVAAARQHARTLHEEQLDLPLDR